MKKHVQRIAILLMALLLLVGVVPVSAGQMQTNAVPEAGWVVYIGGVKVYDAQDTTGMRNSVLTGAKFDPASMTVTLNSFDDGVISVGNASSKLVGPLNLNVVVNGECAASVSATSNSNLNVANINVTGSGTLYGGIENHTQGGNITVSNLEVRDSIQANDGVVNVVNAQVWADSIYGAKGVNINVGKKGSVVLDSNNNYGAIQVGFGATINVSGGAVIQEGRSPLATPTTYRDLERLPNAKKVSRLSMRANSTTIRVPDPTDPTGTSKITVRVDTMATAMPFVAIQPKAKSLKFNAKNVILFPGQKTRVRTSVLPENAASTKVTFKSNKTSVATVDKDTGVVTAVAPGRAVITARNAQNRKGTCTIIVGKQLDKGENFATWVEMNRDEVHLGVNRKFTLSATVYPKDATFKKLEWKSSDPKVATVTGKGVVKGKSAGYCTITATTPEGIKASCYVRVY